MDGRWISKRIPGVGKVPLVTNPVCVVGRSPRVVHGRQVHGPRIIRK